MTTIKYLSICSGIESVGVAWNLLGFECLGLSEIDPFRSAVLNYRYPEVKNHGDFTKIEKEDLSSRPDILVGGTPCATFSVAGYRKGMGSRTGFWTLNTLEHNDFQEQSHKEEGVSSLSDILEQTGKTQQRFYLTRYRCEKLISRSEESPYKIPVSLKENLKKAIGCTGKK